MFSAFLKFDNSHDLEQFGGARGPLATLAPWLSHAQISEEVDKRFQDVSVGLCCVAHAVSPSSVGKPRVGCGPVYDIMPEERQMASSERALSHTPGAQLHLSAHLSCPSLPPSLPTICRHPIASLT